MSNDPQGKISGKVLFGCDYLNIMRLMEQPEIEKGDKYSQITDAVIRLFLLQWEFSIEEIDSSNKVFWDKVNSKTLDEKIDTVIDRIIKFTKNDKAAQERLVIEIFAIGIMNNEISSLERDWANFFKEKFDFRQSEFDALGKRGIDWAQAFDFLGKKYIESGIKLD